MAGEAVPSTGSDDLSAREVLARYLSAQVEELRRQEPRVRAGAPDSVHKMRVSARRARSVLATYSPLLEREDVATLRDELQWVGSTLGEARDAEVLQARIEGLLAAQPGSPDKELVARRIGAVLSERRTQGRSSTIDVLDSERYARLLESLTRLTALAPDQWSDLGDGGREVAGLVLRDWKRFRRRARAAAAAPPGDERDAALHDVRKAAKRLRYAAESAVPVLGRRAVALAASCELLQDLLGEHHDSAVARELLRHVHVDVPAGIGTVAVLDSLRAHEETRAAAVEQLYEASLDLLLRDRPGRWLRTTSRTGGTAGA